MGRPINGDSKGDSTNDPASGICTNEKALGHVKDTSPVDL